MNQRRSSRSERVRVFTLVIPVLLFMASCSPPVQRPVGPALTYSDALDLFSKGKFGRAIEYTESLAKSSPPTPYTDRARVLRVVIFSGQVKAFKVLGEAYSEGWEKAKDAQARSDYGRQRHDNLQYGLTAALNLHQTAAQLTEGGALPKDLTLEAPYPTAEGPAVVAELNRVMDGAVIGAGDQQAASIAAQRRGIDDALAEIVGADRSEARAKLKAGPVKLDNYKFAMYLSKQLLTGASLVDKKHMHDPEKFRTLCGEADEVAKAALATLQDNPDKQKEKEVKKVRDEIKGDLKNP